MPFEYDGSARKVEVEHPVNPVHSTRVAYTLEWVSLAILFLQNNGCPRFRHSKSVGQPHRKFPGTYLFIISIG